MSASLVGSEMCIRDSCPTHELTQTVTTSHDHSAGAAFCAVQAHNAAVSYTHLTLPTICSV
eukprot:13560398-Alexandrium_andersonii.AAC.1